MPRKSMHERIREAIETQRRVMSRGAFVYLKFEGFSSKAVEEGLILVVTTFKATLSCSTAFNSHTVKTNPCFRWSHT